MPDRLIAELAARLSGAVAESDAPSAEGGVLLAPTHLSFRGDGRELTVPLASVFDVVVRPPDGDDGPGETAQIVIGFGEGERRRIATAAADAASISDFRRAVSGELLGDTEVLVATPERPSTTARLRLRSDVLAFESTGTAPVVIAYDDVRRITPLADAPVVAVEHVRDGRVSRTVVSLPTRRELRLLVRHLRSRCGRPRSVCGDVSVLAVGEDGDLLDRVAGRLSDSRGGISVVCADSASRGLRVLESRAVDCVVSDRSTSGMSGVEFLERTRKRDAARPFILFVGRDDRTTARAVDAGVTDYLRTSMRPDAVPALARRIRLAVGRGGQPTRRTVDPPAGEP